MLFALLSTASAMGCSKDLAQVSRSDFRSKHGAFRRWRVHVRPQQLRTITRRPFADYPPSVVQNEKAHSIAMGLSSIGSKTNRLLTSFCLCRNQSLEAPPADEMPRLSPASLYERRLFLKSSSLAFYRPYSAPCASTSLYRNR